MAKKEDIGKTFTPSRRKKKPSLEEVDAIVDGTTEPSEKKERSAPKKPKPKKATPSPPAEPEEIKMKKTSLDLPLELYLELKIKLIKDQEKFKDYITRLIRSDLRKNK